MNRRNFLQKTCLGAAGLMSIDRFTPLKAAAISAAPNLTITKIETVRFKNAHWIWVRLHTDAGVTGTGETYPLSPNSADFKDIRITSQ